MYARSRPVPADGRPGAAAQPRRRRLRHGRVQPARAAAADPARGERGDRGRPAPAVGPAGARAGGRAPPDRARAARRGRPGADGRQDAAVASRGAARRAAGAPRSTRPGRSPTRRCSPSAQLSRLLHPPMLDDMGLAAALDWYLKGFAERTGVAIELRARRHGRPARAGGRDVPLPRRPGGHDQHRQARRGHVVPGLPAAPSRQRRADRRRRRAGVRPGDGAAPAPRGSACSASRSASRTPGGRSASRARPGRGTRMHGRAARPRRRRRRGPATAAGDDGRSRPRVDEASA